MKILQVISSGYRATLEEQDDTVVWLTHMLRRAGAETDVLLRASAVNYVVDGQRVPPLAVGGRMQAQAPDVHGQVASLSEAGVGVFVMAEDLDRYGLRDCPRLEQAQLVDAGALADFLSRYRSIWHW